MRVAGAVREVVGARAAIISRAVDEEWLEIVALDGDASPGIVDGLRWRRSDLDSLLRNAESLGRLRATRRHSVEFAEVPTSTPETERYISGHLGLLLAPLATTGGELLGVLATEGPVELTHPEPGVCERVELYAEQARLALGAQRDRGLLTEQLRLSRGAQSVLLEAGAAESLPTLLDRAAAGLREMLAVPAAWACADLEPGVHARAASYPPEAADALGPDVCDLLQPMVARSVDERRPMTQETEPLLGRLAAVVGQELALLVPLGDGAGSRGTLLAFRGSADGAWSADELEAAFALGSRLGTFADQVRNRRRDREAAQELLRLDEYRRDLVASITHDLKTPLTAITLNTELLESDARLADAESHPVEAIRRSAERLADLVDDLLAMARAEEGTISTAEVDLVPMVRAACEHAETQATLRGVTFEVVAPAELMVTVDARSVARVFANLVANAVKFSLPRGRVVLDLHRVGDVVEFRCTDNGIGIPADRLDTLFDLSRRSPDERIEELPGSGIGLAICHRIVTRLGGTLEVDSVPGRGSTFTVRLPG